MEETLSLLRRRLAALEPAGARREQMAFGLGLTLIDDMLAGGLGRGGLHEILPAAEADASAGRISISSPIARALIGKATGDSVEVNTPGGSRAYEILKIAFI